MISVVAQAFLNGLEPDPEFTVWEWSDKHRFLTSKSSSEPGPWRTKRLPYAFAVMEALSVSHPAREVIVMKGAQLGFTEIGSCWLGYLIDCAPAPILAVQPNLDMAKRFSKQRIDTLIETSPPLRLKVAESKSRDSGNTMLSKDFAGGMLVMAGANSAAGLRSMPCRFLFMDELDAWPGNVEGEGSPVKLAEARTRTYQNKKKMYKVSTPTIEGKSAIATEYERSSKGRFYVPCPYCEMKQTLDWAQIRYDPDNIDATVHYECIECKGKILEHHKTQMLENGEWIHENPNEIYVMGFHISSLYSPVGFYSFAQCAKDYEDARVDQDQMRTWVNTVLGLTFRESGETPDYQRLYERREDYRPYVLPNFSSYITAGLDVQKDRLECMVVGWNRNKEKYLIDYKVFQGDVEQSQCWDEAEAYLNTEFEVEGSPAKAPIAAFAIDSGFATPRVIDFARRFSRRRCYLIKGTAGHGATFIGNNRQAEVRANGTRVRTGIKIWNIYPDIAKGELFRHLLLPMPEDGGSYPKGYFHFHKHLSLEWFKGLCSEELKTKKINGFDRYFYEKIFRRNEQLDCYVYARAAFTIVGGDRFTDAKWKAIEDTLERNEENFKRYRANNKPTEMSQAALTREVEPVALGEPKPRVKVEPVITRRKSSWL